MIFRADSNDGSNHGNSKHNANRYLSFHLSLSTSLFFSFSSSSSSLFLFWLSRLTFSNSTPAQANSKPAQSNNKTLSHSHSGINGKVYNFYCYSSFSLLLLLLLLFILNRERMRHKASLDCLISCRMIISHSSLYLVV